MRRETAVCSVIGLFLSATALGVPAAVVSEGDRSAWAGRWKLDPERSDAPGPMLKALEAPWYARAIASAARPTLEIEVVDGGLRMVSDSPLQRRERRLHGDGVERSETDQLGRPSRARSQWTPVGSMAIERAISLGDGRIARVEISWRLEADTLTATIQIRNAGKDPVRVRRVFERKVGDD